MGTERYRPESYPDWVIPDELTPVNVEELNTEFMVGHKYDHVRYHPQIDHYILKVSTDDVGMVTMHIDEATAGYVMEQTGIELMWCENMTRTEYDAYVEAQSNDIEWWAEE